MIEKYVDSKELKRLLATLLVIVGCLIIAALFGILVVPGLRNANKPAVASTVTPVVGETGWLDPTEFPVQEGRVIPPVDPQTLIQPSEELLTIGKKLYEEDCLTCHGGLGRGDGPASNINPKPRNFTDKEGWVNGPDMPGVFKTLSNGIPGSSMASYDILTKKERMALVHYIQSLDGYHLEKGSPEDMKALAEELAAPGEKTNNKIPVSMAMGKLEREFSPAAPLTVAGEDHSAGAEIFRRTVMDASRAAQVLNETGAWRKGPAALARCIIPDLSGNGFSSETATLKPGEWQALYDELVKRIGKLVEAK